MSARLPRGIAVPILASLASLWFQPGCLADEGGRPVQEWWLNAGMYSYHFRHDKDLNDENFGLGIEYRYTAANALTAGFFRNSDRETSSYLGWYWQPIQLGPARLGAVLGALDGYPRMRDGGWFPALIPALSAESGKLGVNVFVIPGYQDRLYGAVSVQVKLRLH